MQNILASLLIAVFLTATSGTPEFEHGMAAYDAGDYTTARTIFHAQAQAGEPQAQYMLGIMYEAGDGVLAIQTEAVKWYRLAANQGYAGAQTRLGLIYRFGLGVQQNYMLARSWFHKAADQGDAVAQQNLGHLFRLGTGAPADHKTAASWFRKAADQGLAESQHNLAMMLMLGGAGVDMDLNAAAAWFRQAGLQGHVSSQYALGQIYEIGHGLGKNPVSAHLWYGLAVRNGHKKAAGRLAKLAASMTPEDIADAKQRTLACLSTNYDQCH